MNKWIECLYFDYVYGFTFAVNIRGDLVHKKKSGKMWIVSGINKTKYPDYIWLDYFTKRDVDVDKTENT